MAAVHAASASDSATAVGVITTGITADRTTAGIFVDTIGEVATMARATGMGGIIAMAEVIPGDRDRMAIGVAAGVAAGINQTV